MAALGAAGLLAVGAAAPSAAATGPAPCGTSFNPYDYSAAADRACGDTVTPLTGVTSAMGGGKTYTYTAADGETSQEHVLPPNFDGLTASAAELAAYDLPARPTGLNQLAQWAQELAHIKLASPPPFLAQTPNPVTPAPASSEVFPYPWSGYASVYKKDGTTRLPLGTYSYITMAFIEPSYNNDVCPNGEAYIWSGLGGIGSTALPQTGTAHNVNNLGNHQAWYVLEINNQ